MDNLDRIYEITRLIRNAQHWEGVGVYLTYNEVARITDHLGRLYDALQDGDIAGEDQDWEEEDEEDW